MDTAGGVTVAGSAIIVVGMGMRHLPSLLDCRIFSMEEPHLP